MPRRFATVHAPPPPQTTTPLITLDGVEGFGVMMSVGVETRTEARLNNRLATKDQPNRCRLRGNPRRDLAVVRSPTTYVGTRASCNSLSG